MKTPSKSHFIIAIFISTCMALFFSACTSAANTVQSTDLPLSVTIPPESTPTIPNPPKVWFDLRGLAKSFDSSTIPAVSKDEGAPWWVILPKYDVINLQGYLVPTSSWQPRIYIYPLGDLENANEQALKVVASLQDLIKSPREISDMPFLPLTNSLQVIHTQIQYLDFKNGNGVRYLTQFNQGIVPINNSDLVYTYQGITSDGRFYIAVTLPVTHPTLPANGTLIGSEPPSFLNDHQTYLADTAQSLNTQTASSFTPDLTMLDAMISSIEIK